MQKLRTIEIKLDSLFKSKNGLFGANFHEVKLNFHDSRYICDLMIFDIFVF